MPRAYNQYFNYNVGENPDLNKYLKKICLRSEARLDGRCKFSEKSKEMDDFE